MHQLKKIALVIEKKMLGLKYVISEKWYIKACTKYLRHLGVRLDGTPKFVARDVKFDTTDPTLISIGEGSVVTSRVTILVHDYSIECGLVTIGREDPEFESRMLRPVKIGRNCFIGQQAFLKPGTEIGDNCIIGAAAVVSGKIPEGSIVVGNPGTVVAKTAEWAEKKAEAHQYVRGSKRRK